MLLSGTGPSLIIDEKDLSRWAFSFYFLSGSSMSMIICLNLSVRNTPMLIRLVLCDLNCWITKSQLGDAVVEKRVDIWQLFNIQRLITALQLLENHLVRISLLFTVLLVQVPKGLLCLVLAMTFYRSNPGVCWHCRRRLVMISYRSRVKGFSAAPLLAGTFL